MIGLLKTGGILNLSTTDFHSIILKWLAAEDDWKDFYRDDDDAIRDCHWFGTYTYEPRNRWGYLAASIYGPQNSDGQFHKNCYTEGKLKAIYRHFGLEIIDLQRFKWKGDRDDMIRLIGRKN